MLRFSATLRSLQNASSWWTIATPARRACVGFVKRTAVPPTSTVPVTAGSRPASLSLDCRNSKASFAPGRGPGRRAGVKFGGFFAIRQP